MVNTIAGLAYNTGSADGIGSTARFNNPTGIAVDGGGNLYVADEGNNAIRWLALAGTNWMVFTAAGLAGSSGSADGTGNAARFNGPYAIAVDGNTNVYVADSINSTIRRGSFNQQSHAVAVVRSIGINKRTAPLLVWNAMVGHTYQVQFKTNLNQPTWSTLTEVTAPNWTGIVSTPDWAGCKRFYRIVP